MSYNSFGNLFRFTSYGESHGPAIGCIVDGVPPNISLNEKDIQKLLDRRKPGQSKFVTQRKESDKVEILSGVFENKTTGHPIALNIKNEDQRSKDYNEIANKFRPSHADITYHEKYKIRDYRGGGRSSARETAVRVAAGAIALKILEERFPKIFIKAINHFLVIFICRIIIFHSSKWYKPKVFVCIQNFIFNQRFCT